ncbi:MAG: hypothetical protein EA383_00860 [Spirochaetaceae bacterium]|nr:MAG: hypothetical protein EA383_00860 [Spirochaetaceae bacterium]
MDDFHWYYDFRINGDHVGSYEIRLAGGEIYQNSRFRVEGELSVNEYWLKVDSGNVTAFKSTETPRHRDGRVWNGMDPTHTPHLPTCSFWQNLMKSLTMFQSTKAHSTSETGLRLSEKAIR